MAESALALALAAAVLHAVWNLLLARAPDVQAATATTFAIAVALFAPVAAARWDVDRSAIPYIAVSAVFELVYLALLATAYGRAELSVVYPIARGLAPVLMLVVGVAVLGVGSSAVEVSSVVIAVALAAPVLGEQVAPKRLAGAVLVVAGVAVLGAG